MNSVMNVIWFIFCGFWQMLSWGMAGCLWCLTIVGIPVGKQCFKFASFTIWPFGKQIEYSSSTGSFLLNVVWIIFSGLPLALSALCNGLILCITIIGIPFGLQSFKFAKLALMPFGARIVKS